MASRSRGRALVSAGWGRLAEAVTESATGRSPGDSDDLRYEAGSLDHARLLPRCAAAVHHGGAGTTAASTRAGVPTVVCSLFADQPFYGACVERLGVGAHLPIAQLNGARLEEALDRALQPGTVAAARRLGEHMCAEPAAAPRAAELVTSVGRLQSRLQWDEDTYLAAPITPTDRNAP